MRPLPFLFGAYACGVGVLTFLGWALDAPALADWDADGIAMQPNAAIAATLAGAALLLLAVGRRRASAALALAAATLGGATLLQHVSGADLGIDRLFLFDRSWGSGATTSPGRMGLPASTCFLALGLGIVLAGRGPRTRLTASLLGLTTAAVATLSLVGYAFGLVVLYSVPTLTAISMQTATALLALALGLVTAVRDRGPAAILVAPGPGGVLARRLLGLAVAAPPVAAAAALFSIRRGADPAHALASLAVAMMAALGLTVLFTARRVERTAQAVAEREALFRTLGEAVPDLLWLSDAGGRPIYQNPAWAAYTGLPSDELEGRGWERIYHPDELAEVQRAWASALAGGEAFELEGRVRRHDGAYRWFTGRTVPLKDASGRVLRWVGTLTDIEDRKRTELRLAETVDRLETANVELDRFASFVAHDLQEPLRNIAMFTELLTRRHAERLDQEDLESLQFVREGAHRAIDVVRSLLALTRIGRQALDLRPIALADVVETARGSLRATVQEARATITCDPLPEVLADRVLLVQVFQNLIGNAIKFRGPSPCEVRVAARWQGDEWVVSVTDNGIGFGPEEAERIFDAFSRLRPREEHPGVGMGLAICRRIVELHGGRIWADARRGEGATFSFTLRGTGRGEGPLVDRPPVLAGA